MPPENFLSKHTTNKIHKQVKMEVTQLDILISTDHKIQLNMDLQIG